MRFIMGQVLSWPLGDQVWSCERRGEKRQRERKGTTEGKGRNERERKRMTGKGGSEGVN